MNAKLRQKAKSHFEKFFFLSWWKVQFWKNYGNRNIKLVTTETRRNYLVSEPNYHTKKLFTENVLAIEMRNINE